MTGELHRWPGPRKNDEHAMALLDRLNAKYGPGYMVLLACLSQQDPLDLLPMAPPDEYAREAAMIWEQLPGLQAEEALAAVIQTVFGEAWRNSIEPFAHDFWARWQAFQVHPYTPKWRAGTKRVKAQIEVPVKD